MRVTRLSPDIYEIEDFVTVEQQTAILEYARSLDESEWWNDELKGKFFDGKQKLGKLPDVFHDIDDKVETLFKELFGATSVALQRHLTGNAMGVHQDNFIKGLDHHMRFGIVIYYNDNYVGGEIHYPDLSITHKPKARSLIMHGGNISHGTMPVTGDGYRYFSTCFVKESIDKPVILNQEIFGDVELSDGSAYP